MVSINGRPMNDAYSDVFERPPEAAKIWRYLDFAKLVDMVDRGALFFARADAMLDPWEGRIGTAGEISHVEQILAALPDEVVTAGYAERVRAEYRAFRHESIRQIYLSCWYVSEHESAAMWELYAGRDGRGVAIQSSFGRLRSALPATFEEHAIRAGLVRYIDYSRETVPVGNRFYPFLHKRLSFEHERELRAVLDLHPSDREPGPEGGVNVPVDTATLIDHVHVAPTAPTWFTELVARTVEHYGLMAPVVRSNLLVGPIV